MGLLKEDIVVFLKTNKNKVLIVFAIYCACILSIGIVNFPYYDDVGRRIYGTTTFWKDFCRLLSEISSYIVHGSSHLTDMGLTAFFLSALIMTFSSVLLLYIFIYQSNKKVTWISTVASVYIGINPWFLQCLSYHFDSPYICLSILVSIIPFLFYKNKKMFFGTSLLGCFLMCNSYQASSGIFLIILITLLYIDLSNEKKSVTNSAITGLCAYCLAMILYKFEMKLNPEISTQRGVFTQIASFRKMPIAIFNNLIGYFKCYITLSSKISLFFAILVVIIFVINTDWVKGEQKKNAYRLNIFYIIFGSIFSYGAYMFFSTCLAEEHPRYAYGLSFFFGILLILLGQKTSKNRINYIRKLSMIMMVYYSVSFVFVYANVLDNQKDSFENYSVMLASDLNNYLATDNQTIHMNMVCEDSLVFKNSAVNYPILNKLVPSNKIIYWINEYWFNSITGMNVNMESCDFNEIDMNSMKLLKATKLWDIYILNNDIYLYWK